MTKGLGRRRPPTAQPWTPGRGTHSREQSPTHPLALPSPSPHQGPDPPPPGLPTCPWALSALTCKVSTFFAWSLIELSFFSLQSPQNRSCKFELQILETEDHVYLGSPRARFIPRLQTQHCVAPHQRDSPWCYSPPDPAQPAFGRSRAVPKGPPAKPSAPGEQKFCWAWLRHAPLPFPRQETVNICCGDRSAALLEAHASRA